MVEDIRDPTGDTGKGVGVTVQETWRDRTMVTTQDSVVDAAVPMVGERTEITAEAEVCEGEMVPPPPPTGRT